MPAQRSPSSPYFWEQPRRDPEHTRRATAVRLHDSGHPLPATRSHKLIHSMESEILYRSAARKPHEIIHVLVTVSDRFEHSLTRRDVSACPPPSKGQAHVAL